jgi:hypothetical protein
MADSQTRLLDRAIRKNKFPVWFHNPILYQWSAKNFRLSLNVQKLFTCFELTGNAAFWAKNDVIGDIIGTQLKFGENVTYLNTISWIKPHPFSVNWSGM